MRSLSIPTTDGDALYVACAQATASAALRTRLLGYQPRVATAAQAYRSAGELHEFHTLPRVDVPSAADAELRALYRRTMVRKTGPGRSVYDVLMLAAKGGLCPLCGERNVSSLDHYLPKESYPDLAILPLNLVPACSDCNYVKLGFYPVNATEQLLHPYFDTLPDGVWLHATVAYKGQAPLLTFRAEPPPGWNVDLRMRVMSHFERLRLSKLYSIHGTAEVPMIRWRLQRLLEQGGPIAVRDHLQEEAQARKANEANSWQAATYTALAAEHRFWNGGFGAGA